MLGVASDLKRYGLNSKLARSHSFNLKGVPRSFVASRRKVKKVR